MATQKLSDEELLKMLNLVSCIEVICNYIEKRLSDMPPESTEHMAELKRDIHKEFNW